MANTYSINIDAGSDLAISGNYTITAPIAGDGEINFKGAGAEITSDGKGPATFTNANSIDAFYSGQIGDAGKFASNDLTFVNDATVIVSGADDTLTINTGANTIVNHANGLFDAETEATLALVSNVTNQGIIDLGGTSALGTSTGTVDLGKDGGSGSMTNTGEIDILVGSDLEISGNYAISGSGVTYFKGASTDITSDGAAAATFTNKSTIEADYSGQIGDQGIKSANDLTFVNAHNVLATGSRRHPDAEHRQPYDQRRRRTAGSRKRRDPRDRFQCRHRPAVVGFSPRRNHRGRVRRHGHPVGRGRGRKSRVRP